MRSAQVLTQALALLPLMLAADASRADPLPGDPLQRRCWLGHTVERSRVDLREPVAVHFSNLRNGDVVRSPFWVEFGVRGMGVIPAGNANDKAGHHHLLIDTPLPRDHLAALPFSANYRHFGKAQTGTQVELPPGRHTLRLLFADHAHKPYFVFSPQIEIQVRGGRSDPPPTIRTEDFRDSCAAWYADQRSTPRTATREVYVKNLRDNEPVTSPFSLSFGVAGLGVAPAGTAVKDTGHFEFSVLKAGAVVQRQSLADGRTEAVIDLPAGEYELQLGLHDGSGASLLKAPVVHLVVQAHQAR